MVRTYENDIYGNLRLHGLIKFVMIIYSTLLIKYLNLNSGHLLIQHLFKEIMKMLNPKIYFYFSR